MNFQSFFKFLIPKEDKFYNILETQAALAYKAAQAFELFTHSSSNSDVSISVQDIEHEGDKLVTLMEEELAKTFVTPIDREDLHKLSVEMDDVIDFCNQAARSCVLFSISHPTVTMSKLMAILVKCTKHLSEVMPSLKKNNFMDFYTFKGAIKELEKEADKLYREEVSNLVVNENNFKTFFFQKEVIDKLENAIDRCEDISQFLVNLAVKHG